MISAMKIYCANTESLLEFQFENATHIMNEDSTNKQDSV